MPIRQQLNRRCGRRTKTTFLCRPSIFGDVGGYRRQLAEQGIRFIAKMFWDDYKTLMGGTTYRSSYKGKFFLGLDLDAQKLLGIPDGKIIAVCQGQTGSSDVPGRAELGKNSSTSKNCSMAACASTPERWTPTMILTTSMKAKNL